VIYGGNGAGKSGYARVMKKACRARDQSEVIHPNADDPSAASSVPTAIFNIKQGEKISELEWSRDTTPPDLLSSISVFDSKCARSYITTEQDVAYLPYGLDILENLANKVIPKLTEKLETEAATFNVSKLPFEHLFGDTTVGAAIHSLSTETDVNYIKELATLSSDDVTRISELQKILNEANPLAKATELKLSAMRLKTYSEKLARPLALVGDSSIEKLKTLINAKNEAEESEILAVSTLQSGEQLLPGTGEHKWKSLFESARNFVLEPGPEGKKFPPSTSGEACPLCQESLSASGVHRLRRFNEYILNDVAKTADATRTTLMTAKNALTTTDLNIIPEKALSDELSALDGDIEATINNFQTSVNERRQLALQCIDTSYWSDNSSIPEDAITKTRKLSAQKLRAHRSLLIVANEEKRQQYKLELSELIARQNLTTSLPAVIELLDRLKKQSKLESCRSMLRTRPISDKSKELATSAVTEKLRKALDQEFHALGVGHIKTTLKERNTRGKVYHQLLLNFATTKEIDEILSEGEQCAIALGAFFAELTLAGHTCGIVFDDPVSSLDHWRRRNVAQRLVQEAKNRQVIIFTHDTSFLGQLCDEVEAEGINYSQLYLEWQNGSPGHVNQGLPWEHQGYKERLNALEQTQKRLSRTWSAYPSTQEVVEMRHQYDLLRATLERVIQDVVFNGVVKRYRDWIQVGSLKDVVGFDQTEYEVIQNIHSLCCDVVTAHDPSSAKNTTIRTPSELEADINELKAVIDSIKKRRKTAKSS
jgi:hypothetical protein